MLYTIPGYIPFCIPHTLINAREGILILYEGIGIGGYVEHPRKKQKRFFSFGVGPGCTRLLARRRRPPKLAPEGGPGPTGLCHRVGTLYHTDRPTDC